jgi:hypothetical protein
MAEDADFGPGWVVSWSACSEVEVGRVGEMETIDDFEVGEGIQSCRGVGAEAATVDSDDAAGAAPLVIGRLDAPTDHLRDGLDLERLACHEALLPSYQPGVWCHPVFR